MASDTKLKAPFMRDFNVDSPAEMGALMIHLHGLLGLLDKSVNTDLKPYKLDPIQKTCADKILLETNGNPVIKKMVVWFASHWNQPDNMILSAAYVLRDHANGFARMPGTQRKQHEAVKANWEEFTRREKKIREEAQTLNDLRSANMMMETVVMGHSRESMSDDPPFDNQVGSSSRPSRPTPTRAEYGARVDSFKCLAEPPPQRSLNTAQVQSQYMATEWVPKDPEQPEPTNSRAIMNIKKTPLSRAGPTSAKPRRRIGLSSSPLSSLPPSSPMKSRQATMKDGFNMGQGSEDVYSEDEIEAVFRESSSAEESLPGDDTEYIAEDQPHRVSNRSGKRLQSEESISSSDIPLSVSTKRGFQVGAVNTKRRKIQSEELSSSDIKNLSELSIRKRTRAAIADSRGFVPIDDEEEEEDEELPPRSRNHNSSLERGFGGESKKPKGNGKRKPSQVSYMSLENELSKKPRFSKLPGKNPFLTAEATKPHPNITAMSKTPSMLRTTPELQQYSKALSKDPFLREVTPDTILATAPSSLASSTKREPQHFDNEAPIQNSSARKNAYKTSESSIQTSSARKQPPKANPNKPPTRKPSAPKVLPSIDESPVKNSSAAKALPTIDESPVKNSSAAKAPPKRPRPSTKKCSNQSTNSTTSRLSKMTLNRGRGKKKKVAFASIASEDEDEDEDEAEDERPAKKVTTFPKLGVRDGQTPTVGEELEVEEDMEIEKKPRKARKTRTRSIDRRSSLETVDMFKETILDKKTRTRSGKPMVYYDR